MAEPDDVVVEQHLEDAVDDEEQLRRRSVQVRCRAATAHAEADSGRADEADRRSFRTRLTDKGYALVDAAMTKQTANVTRLLAPLTERQLASLDATLRTLLAHLES